MSVITIERRVLEKNDAVARALRSKFASHGLFALNIVSSPGSGKTSLLERTLERIRPARRVGVVEGDVQTSLDAERVARYDVPVVQIVTNGGCHLDAELVERAVGALDLASLDVLVVENVGNLVCPANYDLGESVRVVVVSTTEGDDKPLKYPAMFRGSSVLVINKIDLLPYVPCDLAALRRNALAVNPALAVFELSCATGAGLDAWTDWLLSQTGRRDA